MKKIIILLLIFITIKSFSQNILKDTIIIYNIVDEKFKNILDSFLIHEQQYSYYDSSNIFILTLDEYKYRFVIQLISGQKNPYEDSIKINLENNMKYKNIYFYYKNLLFNVIIRNKESDLFETRILKPYVKKEIYIISDKNTQNGNITFDIEDISDDYWPTTWIYLWDNDIWKCVWKSPIINIKDKPLK